MAGWTIWKAAAAALLTLGALVYAGPAWAGPAGVPLAVCVARVQPGDTPARLLAAPARFNCSPDQYRLGSGDFWVLSSPVPAAAGAVRPRVRFNSLWQEALTLHAIFADGKMVSTRVDGRGLSRHLQLGAVVEFRLPYRDALLERVLFRVDGTANLRGVMLDLRISDVQKSAGRNVELAAMYAAFGGLALALLIYNLALWGALRHRFQLTYCAMVITLAAYALSSSGALAWFVSGLDNNDRLRVNYVSLGLTAAAALLFARTFFEEKVFGEWLRPLCSAAIALLALSGIAFVALSYVNVPLGHQLYGWSFLAGLSIVPAILYRALRTRSRFLWLFALAWAAPIFFAFARTLAMMHLLPATFWIDNSTVLSLAFEALLSSLAIAYRVQILSRERDEARAQEMSLRMLADADPLTGLLNRRSFLHAAIGRNGAQTLHIIDIDHFKAVNETLGHDGGDEVLRLVARTLRQVAATDSLVARLGGEEFAVLASAAHPVDPDRILAALRQARMPFDLTVTASIGSCTGDLTTEPHWKQLYRDADRALFQAKAAGRDRVKRAEVRALAA